MQTEMTATHYAVRKGVTCLQVGATDDGRPICYREGDVLPADVGQLEFESGSELVELRPGEAEVSEAHDPTGGGVATIKLPEAGPGRGMTEDERAKFAAEVAGMVRAGMSEAEVRALQQEAAAGDANLAERERVDKSSKDKATRRNKRRGG